MPPKAKVSKEEVINAAVTIVRQSGTQAINARSVASLLKCSTQPVFSNFVSMDELRFAVVEKADALYNEYIQEEIASNKYPPYKASGMAYIRFAKEEKELFKLLYMRDRAEEGIKESAAFGELMETVIKPSIGLEGQEATLFHLEMWAFVHGIATMFATGYLNLKWELVSKMLTDAYMGMRKQYGME